MFNDGSYPNVMPSSGEPPAPALVEFYLSDHLRLGRYITLLGGERFSIYRGGFDETAIYPRIGATVEIPRLHWVLRGFYGHFFQPAPLETVSSSVLNYAGQSRPVENTFTPLPSERDEEHQFGIQIPYKGWLLDVANVKNRVNNFLDHSNLGESNIYFPIAVDGALVRAWELTLRSPELARFGQFHLTYSNQIAQQRGNIIGGFTCARSPTRPGLRSWPQLHLARPRPARNAQHRLHSQPSPAHLVCHKCLLRIGILKRPGRRRRRPLQRTLSARAHHIRRLCGPRAGRAIQDFRIVPQRNQSPCLAR